MPTSIRCPGSRSAWPLPGRYRFDHQVTLPSGPESRFPLVDGCAEESPDSRMINLISRLESNEATPVPAPLEHLTRIGKSRPLHEVKADTSCQHSQQHEDLRCPLVSLCPLLLRFPACRLRYFTTRRPDGTFHRQEGGSEHGLSAAICIHCKLSLLSISSR